MPFKKIIIFLFILTLLTPPVIFAQQEDQSPDEDTITYCGDVTNLKRIKTTQNLYEDPCPEQTTCVSVGADIFFCNVKDDGTPAEVVGDLPLCSEPDMLRYRLPEEGECPQGTYLCYMDNLNIPMCESPNFDPNEPDSTVARKTNLIDANCDPSDASCLSSKPVICGEETVKTAIGCISTKPQDLITAFIKLATGISGGIALLLMIFASIKMILSHGNADQLKSGRDQFTSAVIGLLFVIFAVFLMQLIGVNILDIPGIK